MTREIKFRAWDKSENGYMMEVLKINWEENSVKAKRISDGQIWSDHKDQFILLQFTGLKDKNGVEIYEGDIFKAHAGANFPWVVKHGEWKYWDKSGLTPMFGFFTERNDHGTKAQLPLRPDGMDTIEVIGNIYQNPELLK